MTENNSIIKLINGLELKNINFSDILIKENSDTWVKVNGEVKISKWTKTDIDHIKDFLNIHNLYSILKNNKSVDYTYTSESWKRYRVNASYSTWLIMLIIRNLGSTIRKINELWIPERIVNKIISKEKWLVIICWSTGSWKTTTLNWIVDFYNQNKRFHIVTIENPVEYLHESHQCLINQKELWKDFNTIESCLEDALRQAPNVIVLWEIKNMKDMKLAIDASNTWHIVLLTMHSNDVISALNRIIAILWTEILTDLSSSLIWVFHQDIKYVENKWRLIMESMFNNMKVWIALRQNKIQEIRSIIETWSEEWMFTHKQFINELFKIKKIDDSEYKILKNLYESR